MNSETRNSAYTRQTGSEKLTPKQRKRYLKKRNAEFGNETAARRAVRLATPPEEFTEAVNPQVRAKVGIITYTGFVVDDEFHYQTKGGVAKVARKFTVL